MSKKLSTEEILKMARKQTGVESASSETTTESQPAQAPVSQQTTSKPTTAEILAKAKKQAISHATTAANVNAPVAAKTDAVVQADQQGDTQVKPDQVALPSMQEMVTVLKGEPQSALVPEAKKTLPTPTKPLPKPIAQVARRSLLKVAAATLLSFVTSPFALAWTTLTGITATWTLATARFMFPNVLVEPPTRFKIGAPSDYPPASVSTKWTAARGIWVIHTDQYQNKDAIYALATVCTHLGCTPSWLDGEQKFKCPCHGSGFYITGINFEGPAPRPLERVGLRIAPDGMLEVDKSVKFQEEKGQWQDGKSYVQV